MRPLTRWPSILAPRTWQARALARLPAEVRSRVDQVEALAATGEDARADVAAADLPLPLSAALRASLSVRRCDLGQAMALVTDLSPAVRAGVVADLREQTDDLPGALRASDERMHHLGIPTTEDPYREAPRTLEPEVLEHALAQRAFLLRALGRPASRFASRLGHERTEWQLEDGDWTGAAISLSAMDPHPGGPTWLLALRIAARSGDPADAFLALEREGTQAEDPDERFPGPAELAHHAEICLLAGRTDEARGYARLAVEQADQQRAPADLVALAHLALGEALLAAGEAETAAVALDYALDMTRARSGGAHPAVAILRNRLADLAQDAAQVST